MSAGLDANAVYVSPRGHRCRWVPLGLKYLHAGWYYFEYLSRPHGRVTPEGFVLTRRNLHILKREEASHAPAR